MTSTIHNEFVTPPSTPRRRPDHEAYFPPRSHLVGLGLNFEFPAQSTISGLEQCSAPRLGSYLSPSDMRCPSYWSADSSMSSASSSKASRSQFTETTRNNDSDICPSSVTTSSNFAYSPFANAMSPPSPSSSHSPLETDAISSETFGLGLALVDDEEGELNENDAWSQRADWSFRCTSSRIVSHQQEVQEHESRMNAAEDPLSGFAPAPSYSYALSHTSFALLPSVNIDNGKNNDSKKKKQVMIPSLASSSFIPALSSSLLDVTSKVNFENATGDDPLPANYDHGNKNGVEKKRKRKESSIAPMSPNATSSRHPIKQESENVKRLKSSPALKHLSIFTRAAMLEEREMQDKQSNAIDAFSGLCVDATGGMHHRDQSPSLPPSIVLESTPELAPSPSLLSTSPSRTVDCTLLVSNIPSESPYPPTPSSSAFAPFLFSSTIESLASPSSISFQEEIKRDICHKLSLSNMGMSVKDVNVFSAAGVKDEKNATTPRSLPSSEALSLGRGAQQRCGDTPATSRRGMVVVIHTA